MGEQMDPFSAANLTDFISSQKIGRPVNLEGQSNRGHPYSGLKKRGQSSRSWVKIDENGNSAVLELDKATIMKRCSLPSRDLRLLDPLFIYPSSILGRERAIVVSLEKIRCIITAEEVILMNARGAYVVQYQSELCKRLQSRGFLRVLWTVRIQSIAINLSKDDVVFVGSASNRRFSLRTSSAT